MALNEGDASFGSWKDTSAPTLLRSLEPFTCDRTSALMGPTALPWEWRIGAGIDWVYVDMVL